MNRRERLRSVLPGADDDLITRLASLPAPTVADVVTALRQAHRNGRAHEREFRAQRKRDDREHGNYDEEQLADRTAGVLETTALRAAGLPTRLQRKQAAKKGTKPANTKGSLAALESLARFKREIPALEEVAVAGLRAHGDVSDTEIGVALGYEKAFARQAVGQRFGRRNQPDRCSGDHYSYPPRTGGAA